MNTLSHEYYDDIYSLCQNMNYYEWLDTQSDGELLTPDGETYTRNTARSGLNNNVCAIGSSGTGKSTLVAAPNILRSASSCIISDPKGGLYRSLHELMEHAGYEVKVLNLTHPEKSCGYNPLYYVKTKDDAKKLADTLINNVYLNNRVADPYWNLTAMDLLQAMIQYHFKTQINPKNRSLSTVLDLIKSIEVTEDICDRADAGFFADLDFYCKRTSDNSLKKEFTAFKSLAPKTLTCVISTVTSALQSFCSDGINSIMSKVSIDFKEMAHTKTAFFVIVSDTDRSMDMVANTFYWQAMNTLCDYADNFCANGRLPMPVAFFLDDFSTNCNINNFDNIISNIRARNISATIMFQSIGQLESAYGSAARTILNNCDTTIYMGGNSIDDASYIARLVNKPVDKVLSMSLHTSWIFRRGEKPRFVQNLNPTEWMKNESELIYEYASECNCTL